MVFLGGVQSYNEVASDIPAYGAYTIITYIPYVLMSFLTGISGHNFMYFCNVIMIIIANAIFIILVKPDTKKTCWLIVFSSLSLIYERYVWSGMSEASNCAFYIVMLACSLWLFSDKEKSTKKELFILVILTLLILYYGMVRPFNYIWILIPAIYVLRGKCKKPIKISVIILMFASVILCYLLYHYFQLHWAAKYFSGSGTSQKLMDYLTLIKDGHFGQVFKDIVSTNIDAVKTVWQKVRYGSPGTDGSAFKGVVIAIFYIHEIILIAHIFYAKHCGKKNEVILTIVSSISGILIYESTVMLYDVNQCYRMILGFVVMSGYMICVLSCNKYIKIARQVSELVLISTMLYFSPNCFALPQKNASVDISEIEDDLSEIFSYDENDAWANTIAKNVESSNMYVIIALPTYINPSTCKDDYLEEAISNDEIKSKYVMLTDTHSLNEICSDKYEIIYQGYGHTIYQTR